MSRTLHGTRPERLENARQRDPHRGDGQIAHPSAAHIGGVAPTHSVHARPATRRSPPPHRPPPLRRAPAWPRRQQLRVPRGRRPPRSGSARARPPRRPPAGARPSAVLGQDRCGGRQGGLDRRGVARRPGRRCAASCSASAISAAPDGVAPSTRIGRAHHQCLRVIGGVEPSARLRRGRRNGPARCRAAGTQVEPGRHPGELVQRPQHRGHQGGVILQDRGARSGHPAEARRGAAGRRPGAADDQLPRAHRCGVGAIRVHPSTTEASRQRGDGQSVPGRHHLVVTPHGCGRDCRAASSAARHPLEAHRIVGIGVQLQHRAAVLEGAGVWSPRKAKRPNLRRHRPAHRAAAPASTRRWRPSTPSVSASSDESEHATRAEVVDDEPGRLAGDLARQRIAGAAAPSARRTAAAARCRRASSRSAAPPSDGVDAVAGEAAGELVVDAAARHRGAGPLHRRQRPARAGALVVAQQRLQQRRRRELRRATEPAPRRRPRRASTRGHRVICTVRASSAGPPNPADPALIDRSSPAISSDARSDLGASPQPGAPSTRRNQLQKTRPSGSRCRRRTAGRPG